MDDEFKQMRDKVRERLRNLRPLDSISATREPPSRYKPLPALGDEVPMDEIEALRDAGWNFMPGSSVLDQSGKRMFLDADGHLKIATSALNLRFRPDADPASIEAYLSEHAFNVRRKLGFAPNLFLVSIETGQGMPDAVELAQKITDEDEGLVIYAEPVLIEGLSSR